jgi:hypothetical protein
MKAFRNEVFSSLVSSAYITLHCVKYTVVNTGFNVKVVYQKILPHLSGKEKN